MSCVMRGWLGSPVMGCDRIIQLAVLCPMGGGWSCVVRFGSLICNEKWEGHVYVITGLHMSTLCGKF